MRQHRQIHLWITEGDYRLLREQSADERDSVSGILRRLIRSERLRLSAETDQRGPSHASVVPTGELTSQIAARSG